MYRGWCRAVPFDNVIKRIHLVSGSTSPFPNATAEQFFGSYLRHGTGGTCWPSSTGLHALLVALGFEARRGSAAMRDDVVGPVHTHATVLVRIDAVDYWVDTSMLTEYPIRLARQQETTTEHDLNPARVQPVGDLWRIWWQHPFKGDDVGCLLLDEDVTAEHYHTRYEASRDVSPFNTGLHAMTNFADAKVTVAFDHRFEKRAGGISSTSLDGRCAETLIEEFGYSEEIVAALPPDDDAPVPST